MWDSQPAARQSSGSDLGRAVQALQQVTCSCCQPIEEGRGEAGLASRMGMSHEAMGSTRCVPASRVEPLSHVWPRAVYA